MSLFNKTMLALAGVLVLVVIAVFSTLGISGFYDVIKPIPCIATTIAVTPAVVIPAPTPPPDVVNLAEKGMPATRYIYLQNDSKGGSKSVQLVLDINTLDVGLMGTHEIVLNPNIRTEWIIDADGSVQPMDISGKNNFLCTKTTPSGDVVFLGPESNRNRIKLKNYEGLYQLIAFETSTSGVRRSGNLTEPMTYNILTPLTPLSVGVTSHTSPIAYLFLV